VENSSTIDDLLALVSLPAPPWVVGGPFGGFMHDVRRHAMTSGMLFAELDCRRMTTLDELYSEFARILRFPDYFGRNWPAFDECVADLEWLPAPGYIIFLQNAELLLAADPEERGPFFRIIKSAANEWATPITGTDWDRPALPFHMLLDVPAGSIPRVRQMVEQATLSPAEFRFIST
jgi:hypothetical protein